MCGGDQNLQYFWKHQNMLVDRMMLSKNVVTSKKTNMENHVERWREICITRNVSDTSICSARCKFYFNIKCFHLILVFAQMCRADGWWLWCVCCSERICKFIHILAFLQCSFWISRQFMRILANNPSCLEIFCDMKWNFPYFHVTIFSAGME